MGRQGEGEGRIGSYDVCRVLEYTCLDPVLRHDDFLFKYLLMVRLTDEERGGCLQINI